MITAFGGCDGFPNRRRAEHLSHLNRSSECDRPGHSKELFQEAANNPPLTRQVLSSTVTVRLGGGRAASRRQIKLTLTAAVESPIPKRINEGGGDSGIR